ncbi:MULTISPECIES: DUF167 domain-containing protein [Francisella]|uniref:UPF0235 protein CGC43_00565 n=1 Tax=Francisella opportunistica TaxID=2016517 RepID=A0A345JPE2_9GAMM|nr:MULTISPECIES: DUF167 domain-containing protein [Francisella]APC90852.1 hypothetical protein BBG19_0114 [Francisella sp. MA067296]AXH29188.1 DUF167 domain-containing protein [Francisella opportunistica]AXH30839.1 hypothetical protein CGC44_00565 [Francisella opportunistica]AXH32484.1 hypothetical protein CGC45_00565 [Francisella opportunistica]
MSFILAVYIQPNSAKSEVCGVFDGLLKIKIASPAIGGKANKTLIEFIAKEFKIKKKLIRIIKGETSRKKLLEINLPKIPDNLVPIKLVT